MLWILCFCFWSYAPSKLLSHFHYGRNSLWASYCSFFLCNFSSFFNYIGSILVTNNFSVRVLIDRYILAIQQIITHKEHLRYSFDLWRYSELPQKPWHHGRNNRKWLKQPQSHFLWAIPHQSLHFSQFWCMLCTATPNISSSSENINIKTAFPDCLSVSYYCA